jgi:hypothetical protein
MRRPVDAERLRRFMQALGPEAEKDLRLYFTGGATVNIELAAPDQFIPEVPGWQDRSLYIAREGRIAFYHYDLYSQALAKIERGHSLDLEDVRKMLETGLVDRQELLRRFAQIEPRLHQHPAIDPVSFRHAVEELASAEK